MLKVVAYLFISLSLSWAARDNPLNILNDEFTIVRPFTVQSDNASFYCKVCKKHLVLRKEGSF